MDGSVNTRWKLYQTAIWGLLALVVLWYSLDGFPFPRPKYLFVTVGVIYTLLFIQTYQDLSRASVVSIVTSLSVTSLFLRWSMWTRVVVGSGDYVAHLWGRAGTIVRQGETISNGMYARNPLVHILWAENIIITDIWVFDVRFVALIVSAMFPIFVIYLSKQFFSLRASLFAGILAAPFPIVLRTGALFETEALVIPIFIIQFGIFIQLLKNNHDIRYKILLVALLLLLSYAHAAYPLIIIGVLFGILLLEKVRWSEFVKLGDDRDIRALSLVGIGGPLLLALFRVFSSDLGRARVLRFITGSSTSLPSNPLRIFIPQAGAVGNSLSTNGGSSGAIIPPSIMNWTPIISLLLLAAVGGIYTLGRLRSEKEFRLLFVITAVMVPVTTVSLILFRSSTTMRIGYRNYYFLGIIGLVLAAIGAVIIAELKAKKGFPQVLLLLLIFSYVTIAPMSTIGNNQDPQFGGLQEGMSITEKQQLDNIDTYFKGDDPIYPQPELFHNYIRGPFVPHGDASIGAELHSRSVECKSNNRIWSSDSYAVCFPGGNR